MRFNTDISAKDRRRYELTNFRGVDTASDATDVKPYRATYMKNFISRDGINHKRYGWEEDVNGFVNGKVLGLFEFRIGDDNYKIIHVDNELKLFDKNNNEINITFTRGAEMSRNQSYYFYSNDRVYIVDGLSYKVLYKNENSFIVTEVQEHEDTYIPLVFSNINPEYDKPFDKILALDDYNLLTNKVRYGFVGKKPQNDNSQSFVSYKLPNGKQFDLDDTTILIKGKTVSDDKTITVDKTSTSVQYVFEEQDSELQNTEFAQSNKTFAVYNIGGTIKYLTINVDIDYSKFSKLISGLDIEDKTEKNLVSLSNGMKIKVSVKEYSDNPLYEIQLVDSNDSLLLRLADMYQGNISIHNRTFSLEGYDSTSSLVSMYATFYYATSVFKAYFPIVTTFNKVYDLKYLTNTVGTINIYNGSFAFNNNFDVESDLIESDNIIVTTRDNSYRPSYDINSAKFGILFGANGACDRIFLQGVTVKPKNKDGTYVSEEEKIDENIIFWSEVNDNAYYDGTAFTYFADTSYATIGATQNKVVGMTRLNDSTLAIFRKQQANENDFSILTAKYIETDTTKQDYSLDLMVSVASANMPQTAINNDCFGALGNEVLFASKNGVYAIAISTGSSVERYALERSDPISNLFKNYDMNNAKAIVFENRYYLAVKSKDGNEHAVFIADARYQYKLDRNMDDTKNYEWYIWDNCDVQKWIVENDKLGFYDSKGHKLMFKEGNFVDRKYEIVKKVTRTDNNKYFLIVQELIGKKFYIFGGLSQNGKEWNPTGLYCFEETDYKYTDEEKQEHTTYKLMSVQDDTTADLADEVSIDADKFIAGIADKKNVDAIWLTPTMDLGANDRLKTVFMLTLGLTDSTSGNFEFGYQTKYVPYSLDEATRKSLMYYNSIMSTVSAEELDLEYLGFNSISFGQKFASAFTEKIKIRNFNYIQFIFRSKDDGDICVSGLTMLYKYNTFNKGAK